MQTFSELQIPLVEIDTEYMASSYSWRSFKAMGYVLRSSPYGRTLLEKLRADPRIATLESSVVCLGQLYTSIHSEQIGMWFLWCASQIGEESAWGILEDWLNSEDHTVLNTLWVGGLNPSSSFALNEHCSISTIADMPPSDEKERYLAHEAGTFGVHLSRFPGCAITQRVKVKRLFEKNGHIQNDQFHESTQSLYDLAALVNVLHGAICVPYCHTSYMADWTPPGYFSSKGAGVPLDDVLTDQVSGVDSSVVPDLQALHSAFKKQTKTRQEQFRLILGRLSQAKKRKQPADRLLDLGIVLEMLLLDDNQNKEQLSFSFRLRGSWLLSGSVSERVEKYELLKAIYDARSAVAHTGRLPSKGMLSSDNIKKSFPNCLALVEDIAQRIILSDKPDWSKLVLGDPEAIKLI